VWRRIRAKLASFRLLLGRKRGLSADNFRHSAREIREIAKLSGRLWMEDDKLQDRISRIQREMEQLEQLVEKREFERLTMEKREELRKSLLVSRQELLKCLQAAPCPTDRKQ
jgi:hypothetical protein